MAGDLDAVLRVLERQNPKREDGMTAVFSFDLEAARRATAEVASLRSRLVEARVIIEEDTRWACCGAWIDGRGEHTSDCRLAAFLASGEAP